MRKLNYKEIYLLKLYLGISFSDAESVMNLFFDFKSWNKKFHNYELVPQSNPLDSITDYYNVYMNQNCYVFSSIEDLINYCQDKLPDNKWDLDVLDMICNHFKDIDLNNCTYEEE